jgi:hypothetical protein
MKIPFKLMIETLRGLWEQQCQTVFGITHVKRENMYINHFWTEVTIRHES